jgi:L,D-transpeptidase YcbB
MTLRKAFRGLYLAALITILPFAPAAAQSAPDTVALAVKAEVGGKLKRVYRSRGYWPLWVKDGRLTPAADALLGYVETAALDDLNPRSYDPDELREAIAQAKSGSPEALARAEIKLSETLARYVRDVRRAPTAKIRYLDPEVEPQRMSEAEVLRLASVAPDFDRFVRDMGWMDPAYAGLRRAAAARRERWSDLPHVFVPAGPALKPGINGERVELLRTRLGLAPGRRYDKDVSAAVRAFQLAHGLKADGVAGAGTLVALNRSPSWYDQKIALNLDRARLLPGPGTRHITVDAASQRLFYYRDGSEVGRMKVVVGKPDQQTPMLAGMVKFATLNPYWNVPEDLAYKRVVERVMNGASLQTLGFEAVGGWEQNAPVLSQDQVDWRAVAAGRQNVRLRQLPGPKNAMGKVKFMFPNDLGIYLHDTPERELFGKTSRMYSSGCVRVQDAQLLGEWLFGRPLVAETDTPEQHVPLPEPVPVYLTYLTVQATDDGGVAFLDDAYGRDGTDPRQIASR